MSAKRQPRSLRGFEGLAGQRVLIVGASSGMGFSLARLAADHGARVWMAARNAERLAAAAHDIEGDVETVICDYLDEAEVTQLRDTVGEIDHLVITGKDGPSAPFSEYSRDQVDQAFGKFWGHFFVARAFARAVSPGGSMVFVSGATAIKPLPAEVAVLAAANAAVVALGQGLARELAPTRVNVLVPGIVDTNVWQRIPVDVKDSFYGWAEKNLPARHVAHADELAHAMAFLMTNPYAAGGVHVIDGGLVLIGDHAEHI